MREVFVGESETDYVYSSTMKVDNETLYFDFSDNSFKESPTIQCQFVSALSDDEIYQTAFEFDTTAILSGADGAECHVFVHESGVGGITTPILMVEYNDLTFEIGANPYDITERDSGAGNETPNQNVRAAYWYGGRLIKG